MGSAVSGSFSPISAGYIERCRFCIECFDSSSSRELYVSFAIEGFPRKADLSAWGICLLRPHQGAYRQLLQPLVGSRDIITKCNQVLVRSGV
jgi:hypothetical protein